MKNILFLNDFSNHSANIFHYALRIGQHFDAKINSAHVFEVPVPILVEDNLWSVQEYVEDAAPQTDELYLLKIEELKAFINRETPIESFDLIGNFYIREGDSATEILEMIQARKIDLVVMGMNQQNKLKNALFGNLSLSLINRAECPVLLIPKGSPFENINNIVFAADFGAQDTETLRYLLEWAKAFNAKLDIIHVTEDYFEYVESLEKMNEWNNNFHDEILDEKIKFHLLGGDTEESIEEYLKNVNPDLVCLSTHTRGFWARLLESSTSKDVARKVDVPILILKTKKDVK